MIASSEIVNEVALFLIRASEPRDAGNGHIDQPGRRGVGADEDHRLLVVVERPSEAADHLSDVGFPNRG